MWKIISLVILCWLLLVSRAISYYTAPKFEALPEKVTLIVSGERITEQALLSLAGEYADKHGVSRETMLRITKCEAPIVTYGGVRYYDPSDAQSRIRYTEGQIAKHPTWGAVGERERSFGPSQIHLPDNPEISRDEAVDPHFALPFMAKALSRGETWRWMCK